MAGAEAAVHRMKVEKPEIPEMLIHGSKFIKWPKSDADVSVCLLEWPMGILYILGLALVLIINVTILYICVYAKKFLCIYIIT